jgi:hypothetical protein
VEFPKYGVFVLISTGGGIYRAVGELHRLGEVSFVLGGGRTSKPHGWLARGAASTDSGFSSCRRVATKFQVEPPETLADRPRSWAGRPALGPLCLGSGPTWSMCQIHPCGDDDLDIWSTLPCHPLKWSNWVPMFLKSNKH